VTRRLFTACLLLFFVFIKESNKQGQKRLAVVFEYRKEPFR
jgi:hypothetical protein